MRRIREEKLSVWFMVEGHRNASGKLLPFKTGAFRLAADAQVPVVPAIAEPLPVVVDTRRMIVRRGTFRIRFLPALQPPADSGDEAAIVAYAARVRETMQREFDDLAATAPAPRS